MSIEISRAYVSLDSGSTKLHTFENRYVFKRNKYIFSTESIQNIRTKVQNYAIAILIITLTLQMYGDVLFQGNLLIYLSVEE